MAGTALTLASETPSAAVGRRQRNVMMWLELTEKAELRPRITRGGRQLPLPGYLRRAEPFTSFCSPHGDSGAACIDEAFDTRVAGRPVP